MATLNPISIKYTTPSTISHPFYLLTNLNHFHTNAWISVLYFFTNVKKCNSFWCIYNNSLTLYHKSVHSNLIQKYNSSHTTTDIPFFSINIYFHILPSNLSDWGWKGINLAQLLKHMSPGETPNVTINNKKIIHWIRFIIVWSFWWFLWISLHYPHPYWPTQRTLSEPCRPSRRTPSWTWPQTWPAPPPWRPLPWPD